MLPFVSSVQKQPQVVRRNSSTLFFILNTKFNKSFAASGTRWIHCYIVENARLPEMQHPKTSRLICHGAWQHAGQNFNLSRERDVRLHYSCLSTFARSTNSVCKHLQRPPSGGRYSSLWSQFKPSRVIGESFLGHLSYFLSLLFLTAHFLPSVKTIEKNANCLSSSYDYTKSSYPAVFSLLILEQVPSK